MIHVFARKALLQKGWSDNVRLGIRAGRIDSVESGVVAGARDVVTGVAVPGLCNAHSHAFQRALAGRTEQRSPAGRDNFWTWRDRMYQLVGKLDPQSLLAIAKQAYSEMLASGYTTVAEFHYLHMSPSGELEDDAMANSVLAAAVHSGIRMSYIPVLYERAGFDAPHPEGQQMRFALDVRSFLDHHARFSAMYSELLAVGIGAHSLRAVSPESLQQIEAVAASRDIPLHIHIAEQRREVDECLAAYGRRPVQWLLENCNVDRRWCLVHATHMDDEETEGLAATGAVACLCPSTEANLGDGLFPLRDFLGFNGAIAIGSDSHVSINPFEELRWLEYGQRLASESRNVASLQEAHVGRELFLRALAGGAQVSMQEPAGLQPGAHADLVTLDDDDPMLAGHDEESLLDALVFSGYRLPIERVMVHGRWRVIDGDHVDKSETQAEYAAVLKRIGASL